MSTKETPDVESPLGLAETAARCPMCGDVIRNLGSPDSYRPGCSNERCPVAMIRTHLEYGCKPGAPLLGAWAQIETRLARWGT